MNVLLSRRDGGLQARTSWAALCVFWLLLAGCGGGAADSTAGADDPPVAASCDPADPSTAAQCGTLLVGLTDDGGDFLEYTVDVVSLKLEQANGAIVETLPLSTRINFAEYVNLTEFMVAATVPPGAYVAGSIRLDYGDAGITVDAGGVSKPATVVDAGGAPLTEVEFRIVLPEQDQLLVRRGLMSLLTVDFDLAASHVVDVTPTPARAVAEPFIIAEVDPVDTKEVRVRGLLLEASVEEMTYTVAIRPFYDRIGDFGRITVHVTDHTRFAVNGETFIGAAGLEALSASGPRTLTVAQGTLDVAAREFTANIVLAGSSVPGHDRDGVKGNVISRNGDEVIVRGATVIRAEHDAFFHDDVVVTLGPDTRVYKVTGDRALDSSVISIGQKVTVIGDVTVSDGERIHLDATRGVVRMHLTHLSGIVNSVVPGQADITLHAIDRRRVEIFDFAGTGMSPDYDADPANYEISTGDLLANSMLIDADAVGRPLVAFGFPTAFGAAPPDFEGRTMIDYSDVLSVLGFGWGEEGTLEPFLAMGHDGLLLNTQNPDIGLRHHVEQGPVLIDLTRLDSDTRIVPRESGRMLFVIKTPDSLLLFAGFADFVDHLALALDGATPARSMYARGHYNADTNVFAAHKIGIYLLD